MDKKILAKQKINDSKVFNLLKKLGLKSSTMGIRYILCCVKFGVNSNEEILNMEKIYLKISKTYNVSPTTIRVSIKQSLDHRSMSLSKKNFESVFGYDYNEDTFTNKEFIEEIIRIL